MVQEPAEPAILPHQLAVAGPPAPPGLLVPARFHQAAKLGRHWLCLNCFATPQVGVGTFRRVRCNGPSPAGELPAAQLHSMRLWGHWAALQGELLAHFEPGTAVVARGGGAAPAVQWASTTIGRALFGAGQGRGGAGHGPAGGSPVIAPVRH